MNQAHRVAIVYAAICVVASGCFYLAGTARLYANPNTPCPNACACREVNCLAEVSNVGGMRNTAYTVWYFRLLNIPMPETNAFDANTDQSCKAGTPQDSPTKLQVIPLSVANGTDNCFMPTPPAGTTVRVEAAPPKNINYPDPKNDPNSITQKVCK